jgi:hypothetical protein
VFQIGTLIVYYYYSTSIGETINISDTKNLGNFFYNGILLHFYPYACQIGN